jgi:hypothetical protein
MSRVDNYILTAPCITGAVFLVNLNKRLQELTDRRGDTFRQVDAYAGGPKAMEADVFMGTTNHVQMTTVVQAIVEVLNDRTQVYDKEKFKLFLNGQEDDVFREVTLATQMTHGNES